MVRKEVDVVLELEQGEVDESKEMRPDIDCLIRQDEGTAGICNSVGSGRGLQQRS